MKEKKFSPVAPLFTSNRSKAMTVFAMTCCLLLAGSVTISANSDRKHKKSFVAANVTTETCEVENFGKVNDHYFRGAQPEEEEYEQLAALGVKTVLDLRDDPKDYAKSHAEQAGLRYINLPMSDKKYPTQENVKKFIELARNEGNWPIYVHCAGGRHRTGAMTAVYRMTFEGWDVERAYDEMKDYDFYTRWGHKAMKTFVFDYWKELQAQRARVAVETPVTVPSLDN